MGTQAGGAPDASCRLARCQPSQSARHPSEKARSMFCAGSGPTLLIDCGWRMSRTSRPGPVGCIWRSSWRPGVARWSVGRCPLISIPTWCWVPCIWPFSSASQKVSSLTRIRAALSRSRGLIGDCYDNALCESFFATLARTGRG
jgi:hypothetical protein